MLRNEFVKVFGQEPVEGKDISEGRVVREPNVAVRLTEGPVTLVTYGKVWRWKEAAEEMSEDTFWVDNWEVVEATPDSFQGSKSSAQHRDEMRFARD